MSGLVLAVRSGSRRTLVSGTLSVGVVFALTLAACSSDSRDVAPSVPATESSVPGPDSTTEPPTTGLEVEPSPTAVPPNNGVPHGDDSLRFAWPPVFAVPGSSIPVSVLSLADRQPDSVEVESTTLSAPVSAALDSSSQRWTAVIDVPATWTEPDITLSAVAATGADTTASTTIDVPVVSVSGSIDPDLVALEPEVVVALEFGGGDDEVGLSIPEFEGDVDVPASIQLDPSTGNFVILDSVNRRVLLVSATGEVVDRIEVPRDGWLDDVVVLGATGRAVVSQFRNAGNGQKEIGTALVDLVDGTTTVDGPMLLGPPAPPFGTELAWNPYLDAVYADVFDPSTGRVGYYRLFDTAREELDVSTEPEFWWNGRVGRDGMSVGVEYAGQEVLTQLPHGLAGISSIGLGADATVWWTAGTVNPDAPAGEQVQYYLGQSDLTCAASVIAEIPFTILSENATRSAIADESAVYVVDLGDRYQILRYELPPPTCE